MEVVLLCLGRTVRYTAIRIPRFRDGKRMNGKYKSLKGVTGNGGGQATPMQKHSHVSTATYRNLHFLFTGDPTMDLALRNLSNCAD